MQDTNHLTLKSMQKNSKEYVRLLMLDVEHL